MRKAVLRSTLIIAFFAAWAVLAAVAHAETLTRCADRQQVTRSQMLTAAGKSDLILIGEAHDSKPHHDMQLSIVKALWEQKLPVTIGLEMFEAEHQQILDDWIAGKLSEPQFRQAYARDWNLDWDLYRDIFLFARDNHIPMAGLNISRVLVTKVSRHGFAALTAEEKKDLPEGTTCDLNNPHTAFLKSSFEEVFKHVTNGRVFTYFCEAQTLRNSGMAMNITRYRKKHPGQKIVVLAGVWHAVKNAIPEQLERAGNKLSNTVILPTLPELDAKSAAPDVVDFMVGN
jgi:uncharacterized iron-regulated protein